MSKVNLNVKPVNGEVIAMAEIGLRPKMLVKDVMSSPVVTINENAPANRVAELMDKNDLGCIIVTNKEGHPLGIITERDLVVRVMAKNVKPDVPKAHEVMTSPLITIEPGTTINEAARRMSRLNIRRLGVIYKGQITGLLSSKDVLGVMPELIEIIQERARIENDEEASNVEKEEGKDETVTLSAGYCDHCGTWSEDLKQKNGEFLCEDCSEGLEEEGEE